MIQFNLKQLADLDKALTRSSKAVPAIARQVLTDRLRRLRDALRPKISRDTGLTQQTFGYSIRQRKGVVTARFGLLIKGGLRSKEIIKRNVIQFGSATPIKTQFVWIPFRNNRAFNGDSNISPRDIIGGAGFVQKSKAGNIIAFMGHGANALPVFLLKKQVKVGRPLPIDQGIDYAVTDMQKSIPEMIKQVIVARKLVIDQF